MTAATMIRIDATTVAFWRTARSWAAPLACHAAHRCSKSADGLAAATGSVQNGTAADPRRRDDRLRRIRRLSRLTDLRTVLYTMITPLTLCLTRAQSVHEEPCAVCGAEFVPAEDSGSRQLSLMPADQEPFTVLMCGGCHSRWSHGVTVTIGRGGERSVVPVFRHPERG